MTAYKQSLMEKQFHHDCLETVIKNLHETYQCRMYSRKLMMGKEVARNMWSFITINLVN
jgi:hypothetical protein